ncbi:hypothetical protein O3Q51_11630 [Cryomorphaceae bacterium 1068]|nr:hypothetical protein [Cryomorphaceae bacterium 1068]
MNLRATCKTCGEDVRTRTWIADRVELARTKGEYLDLTCKKCSSTDKYHVDSLYAQPSRFTQITAFTVFVIGTPLILLLLWETLWKIKWIYAILVLAGLLLVPVTIYGLILKDDRMRVSSFNRHKLKGLGNG